MKNWAIYADLSIPLVGKGNEWGWCDMTRQIGAKGWDWCDVAERQGREAKRQGREAKRAERPEPGGAGGGGLGVRGADDFQVVFREADHQRFGRTDVGG
jgi:hypothetical protein